MTGRVHLRALRAEGTRRSRALFRVERSVLAETGLRPGDTVAVTLPGPGMVPSGERDGEQETGPDQARAEREPAASPLESAGQKPRALGRIVAGPVKKGAIELDARALGITGARSEDMVALEAANLSDLQSVILDTAGTANAAPRDLAEHLFDMPLAEGDDLTLVLAQGHDVGVKVISAEPGGAGVFTDKTAITIAGRPAAQPGFEGIGGLEAQIRKVEEMVVAPMRRPDLFERLGLSPPRGILFTGPPGTGKTLLARTVAARSAAKFFVINGPEIVSKHYGDSEAALRQVFEAAEKSSPAIVFIDELDAIAPKREALSGEKQLERRVVAQLLTLLDGLEDRGRVVVMAATNLPGAIDPALRRPGRFDREVGFAAPNRIERQEILAVHLARAPLDRETDLDAIAEAATGYVGADLAALAREAGLAAIAREVAVSGGADAVQPAELTIRQVDLEEGLRATRPSMLRDAAVEIPATGWEDVGGLETMRHQLEEAVLSPIRHAEASRSLGLAPARGILLAGPPGGGKTLLARALANEGGLNFIPVRATRILSEFFGGAERAVADIFEKARHAAPTLLFFDELDALAPQRNAGEPVINRIVAQLLVEMDGFQQSDRIVVLAATNRPGALDPALLRPGRFDLVIDVPMPGPEAREAILAVHLRDRRLSPGLRPDAVARRAVGLSGAAIAALAASAARRAFQRSIGVAGAPPEITQDDLETVLEDLLARETRTGADHLARNEER